MEPTRRSRGLALVALAVAVGAGMWFFGGHRRAQAPGSSTSAQTVYETRRNPERVHLLEDGSVLELGRETRIEVVEREKHSLRLSLRSGRVTCELAKDEARSFVVVAGKVEVHADGARFTLATADVQYGQRVDLNVERGTVEVRGRSGPAHLSAGQSWREDPEPPEGLVPPPLPPPRLNSPISSQPPAPPPLPSAASAGELIERANWARRMGQAREAALAYEALLERFPNDARAGLAAYELGRVRMDSLKDPAGAAKALEHAALAKDSGFREDALARLTRAYTELGKHSECMRAKDRYLRSYPNGAYKDAVSARCAAPP